MIKERKHNQAIFDESLNSITSFHLTKTIMLKCTKSQGMKQGLLLDQMAFKGQKLATGQEKKKKNHTHKNDGHATGA